MTKSFNKTFSMLGALLKRDWLKLIIWILAVLAFAASGGGKFEALLHTAQQRETMFTMFQNPAMISLFGPLSVHHGADFNAAVAFGQTMPLITALVFAIVSVIYVINRTRKDEDDGVAELFRSFQIGKSANTMAVIVELFLLQVIISLILAFSLQLGHVEGMTRFSDNLLFASAIGGQSFMWGMFALVFAQIFPDAGGAKGATFGFLGLLYIIRMGTDVQAVNAGWFNPLSWTYLSDVYVKNDWLPIVLTLCLSVLLIILAFVLESNRDMNAGYLPEAQGRAHAPRSLRGIIGLTLRQQRTAIIGWLLGLLILGFTYGSMFGQIGSFIGSNPTISQMFAIDPKAGETAMVNQYMSTLFVILSVIVTCFAITSFSRMISEERKGRQEQLYALPISRLKMYSTYTIIAWVLGAIAQFAATLGIYLAQSGNKNALSFMDVFKPGMVWVPAIFFVLGLLGLLIAFAPRFTGVIWVYVGFAFFMSYIGNLIKFPAWVNNLDVFHHIPKLPTDAMNWTNFSIILGLALIFVIVGFIGYRKRDLIGG